MHEADLHFRPLTEVAALIESRALSPVELTETILARIERIDPILHSYLTPLPERALAQAQTAAAEIESGHYRGPLHGIPIAIKDLCATKGIRTSCASRILWEHIPSTDATVVQRLEAAGAVILGKLNMTEFALSGYHPSLPIPRNPWNLERATNGSSSGSGVATAAGLCFGSLGTDTGGSIRGPAAWCGVVGLKPTWGRVSRSGVFPLAGSLDHVGPLTRTVADAAAMLQVIAGVDRLDPTSLCVPVPNYADTLHDGVAGIRIGIDAGYSSDTVLPEVTEALDRAALVLAGLGAKIVPIKIERVDAASRAWAHLCAPEALAAHRSFYPARADEYGAAFRSFLDLGATMSATDYATAHAARLKFAGALRCLFEHVDAILCPGIMSAAVPVDAMPPDMPFSLEFWPFLRFSAPYNLSGSPTLSLPGGFTPDGLPIGMQLVGRHLEESLLLQIGRAFEQATEWHTRHPDVP